MKFNLKVRKHSILVKSYIEPDSEKCVQCGICSFNCPIGIDVRLQAWQGISIKDNQCLACGECVARCPRGVLRFVQTDVFSRQAS